METWPENGAKTIIEALEKNVQRIPNNPLMGTKVATGNKDTPWEYKWLTIKEVAETARKLAIGLATEGLIPDIDNEGKTWRFLGIQSKNRKEWFLLHLANMYSKTTTVALYDTLGQAAMKYVINQTELTTVACTPDLIPQLCKLKKEDTEGKMARVANIIVFGEKGAEVS